MSIRIPLCLSEGYNLIIQLCARTDGSSLLIFLFAFYLFISTSCSLRALSSRGNARRYDQNSCEGRVRSSSAGYRNIDGNITNKYETASGARHRKVVRREHCRAVNTCWLPKKRDSGVASVLAPRTAEHSVLGSGLFVEARSLLQNGKRNTATTPQRLVRPPRSPTEDFRPPQSHAVLVFGSSTHSHRVPS